jgi:periplasmic protein TonB
MTARAEILDYHERVAGSFWGSVALHISVAVSMFAYGVMEASRQPTMGDKDGGRMGAVAVNAVHSIPLPSRSAPPNPVANPTESQAPTPPPKAKPVTKVKAPEPDAIPIKSKLAPKKPQPIEAAAPNKFREQQQDQPNQVYSHTGQALSTPMVQMPGAGGVGIGSDSPLGQQFGAYAKLIIDRVAQHWQTTTLNARIQTAPTVAVTFTINRDGSVPQNTIKIVQSSGILPVDISAQRAVMDAAPFPSLPAAYPRNDAQIELRFELRR